MFSVCPLKLATAANAMAGPCAVRTCLPIDHPVQLLESHPRQGNLLALLRHSLKLEDEADSVEAAVAAVLAAGAVTADLGGELGTRAATEAVIDAIRAIHWAAAHRVRPKARWARTAHRPRIRKPEMR